MELTFLEASVPLTKTITLTDGKPETSAYPAVISVTSHNETTHTIAGMYDAMLEHAALGHCLLKGNTVRDLVNESRAGSTVPTAPTDWLCLDIDGLPHKTKIDSFLHILGIDDITHIIQYSASQGLITSDLRCHVFVALTHPVAPPLIKQWLIAKNLELPLLNTALSLTSTHLALKYGLDITTCQNDKLIYIAPPTFKGMKDPFGKKPRISLIASKHPSFDLDITSIPTPEVNRKLTTTAINKLRTAEGLEARSFKTTRINNLDILVKPDESFISGIKTDRGFVYFNLNGGNSWGYYHPENNPDYIHNFKGEPVFRTKELLPTYWEQISTTTKDVIAAEVDPAPKRGSIQYLAFCDRRSSAYYRGEYNESTDALTLDEARNETQIKHFLKQHGLPIGDFIPEWHRIYDPHSKTRVDVDKRTVNLFEPSIYMRTKPIPRSAPPPTILRVIHHALGNNEEITRHFINWLAYIIQKRNRTLTAWLLHGTTGTGKGVLINRILRPLLGDSNVVGTTMQGLEDRFNAFLEHALIVYVDEMEHTALDNSRNVMAKLKNHITEEKIGIREMRKIQYEASNYSNWIFLSNRPNPLAIDREDRRFNVANFQTISNKPSDEEFAAIDAELQHFHDFLALVPINLKAVNTPLITEDRNQQINVSETSLDSVLSEIDKGNFEFFMDELPTDDAYKTEDYGQQRVERYINTLKTLINRTDRKTGVCNIGRDELRRLLEYLVGAQPPSPSKFTRHLSHRNTQIRNVWIPELEKATKGIPAAWKNPELFDGYREQLTPKRQPLQVVK